MEAINLVISSKSQLGLNQDLNLLELLDGKLLLPVAIQFSHPDILQKV